MAATMEALRDVDGLGRVCASSSHLESSSEAQHIRLLEEQGGRWRDTYSLALASEALDMLYILSVASESSKFLYRVRKSYAHNKILVVHVRYIAWRIGLPCDVLVPG